jgi:hypothetical protein
VDWWEQQQDMEPELCAALLAVCRCASIPGSGNDELWMIDYSGSPVPVTRTNGALQLIGLHGLGAVARTREPL